MTPSQANKLGERLRKQDPDEAMLDDLQVFRACYDGPMASAQALVAETIGIAPTARLKTVNTIIEKLRRAKTRLSKMQDIAGVRVVLPDSDRARQDAVVDKLRNVLPGAEVDDLRTKPSHGYRAVHVVANVDGYPVEIQVRTKLQDLWAQAMEKLADRLGRGIRYGESVSEDADEAVATLLKASARANLIEETLREARNLENEAEALLKSAPLTADQPGRVEELYSELTVLRKATDLKASKLRDLLAELVHDLESL